MLYSYTITLQQVQAVSDLVSAAHCHKTEVHYQVSSVYLVPAVQGQEVVVLVFWDLPIWSRINLFQLVS